MDQNDRIETKLIRIERLLVCLARIVLKSMKKSTANNPHGPDARDIDELRRALEER